MKFCLILACCSALTSIVIGQSCTYLYAVVYSQTFDSHDTYGYTEYSTNENKCWIIEAPSDMVVYLESNSFALEDDCCYCDTVKIYDGDSSYFSTPDLTVCGNDGVSYYKSTGRYVYVDFESDSSVQASGFRMSYKYAEADEENYTDDPDEDYTDDFGLYYDYYSYESLSVATIIGIVIGSLLGLALVIGIIVCIVVVVVSKQKRGGTVHTTPTVGQNVVCANQAYYPGQQMYMTGGYMGGATTVVSGTTPTQPPPLAMQQQTAVTGHLVDGTGVPTSAIYHAP